MRRFFLLVFGVVVFAAAAAFRARAQDDAIHLATYVEVSPSDTGSAAQAFSLYRGASRKESGNLDFEVLSEIDRPARFVIVEAWRDATSFTAHNKSESTADYRRTMDAMASAPADIRNIAALFSDAGRPNAPPGAVYVVTHIDVTGDHKEDCVALLRAMHDDTIEEPDNLRYDVFAQKNRPNHFTVVEIWANEKARAEHAAAAHTRTFRQQLLPMQGALYDERIYTRLR
jgi:quinol monooxygenase YgiN